MEGLLATPRVLEIGFDVLSAAASLFVVAMVLRVASTIYAHRQAMRVLAAAAAVILRVHWDSLWPGCSC